MQKNPTIVKVSHANQSVTGPIKTVSRFHEQRKHRDAIKKPSITATGESHSITPLKQRSPAAIHHMSNGATVTTSERVDSAIWSGAGRVHECAMWRGTSG